jgi:hypothetical protein
MDDLGTVGNGFVMGKPKYSEKNLFQCQFVHHKYHIGVLELKPGLLFEMLEFTLRYGDVKDSGGTDPNILLLSIK